MMITAKHFGGEHEECPAGSNSWCRARRNGNANYLTNVRYDTAVLEKVVTPVISKKLGDKDIRSVLGLKNTQACESYHSTLWRFIPKVKRHGVNDLELAVGLATIKFNDGYLGLDYLFELLGLEMGKYGRASFEFLDAERRKDSLKRKDPKCKARRWELKNKKRFAEHLAAQSETNPYLSGAYVSDETSMVAEELIELESEEL